MTPTPEEILTHRLEALGRSLATDTGPAPTALITASRAVANRRIERWSFAGFSLAAGVLIAMGAVAIWAGINSRPASVLTAPGPMTVTTSPDPAQPNANTPADQLATTTTRPTGPHQPSHPRRTHHGRPPRSRQRPCRGRPPPGRQPRPQPLTTRPLTPPPARASTLPQ